MLPCIRLKIDTDFEIALSISLGYRGDSCIKLQANTPHYIFRLPYVKNVKNGTRLTDRGNPERFPIQTSLYSLQLWIWYVCGMCI